MKQLYFWHFHRNIHTNFIIMFCTSEMEILYEDMCEIWKKNQSFFPWAPLFLKQTFYRTYCCYWKSDKIFLLNEERTVLDQCFIEFQNEYNEVHEIWQCSHQLFFDESRRSHFPWQVYILANQKNYLLATSILLKHPRLTPREFCSAGGQNPHPLSKRRNTCKSNNGSYYTNVLTTF